MKIRPVNTKQLKSPFFCRQKAKGEIFRTMIFVFYESSLIKQLTILQVYNSYQSLLNGLDLLVQACLGFPPPPSKPPYIHFGGGGHHPFSNKSVCPCFEFGDYMVPLSLTTLLSMVHGTNLSSFTQHLSFDSFCLLQPCCSPQEITFLFLKISRLKPRDRIKINIYTIIILAMLFLAE